MTSPLLRITAALALGFAGSAFATTIQGVVTENNNDAGAYTGTLSNIRYASGSTGAALPSFSTIVCIDMFDAFPANASQHSYSLYQDATNVIANSWAGQRATDLFNYVVDRYYGSAVLHGNAAADTGYQFNQALWEVASDFDGSKNSLNTGNGWITGNGSVYKTIVGDLRNNFSSIADGYRSTQYTVSFLDDRARGYQSMLMISPVPEPGTMAMMIAGVLGLLAWRRQTTRA